MSRTPSYITHEAKNAIYLPTIGAHKRVEGHWTTPHIEHQSHSNWSVMNIPTVNKRKLQKGKTQKNTIKILTWTTPPIFLNGCFLGLFKWLRQRKACTLIPANSFNCYVTNLHPWLSGALHPVFAFFWSVFTSIIAPFVTISIGVSEYHMLVYEACTRFIHLMCGGITGSSYWIFLTGVPAKQKVRSLWSGCTGLRGFNEALWC